MTGGELTERKWGYPLDVNDNLDENTEEEEECLVVDGEIDSSIERYDEDKLDEKRWVDDDISETSSKSDGDTWNRVIWSDSENESHDGAQEKSQQKHLTKKRVTTPGRYLGRSEQDVDLVEEDHHHVDCWTAEERQQPEITWHRHWQYHASVTICLFITRRFISLDMGQAQ